MEECGADDDLLERARRLCLAAQAISDAFPAFTRVTESASSVASVKRKRSLKKQNSDLGSSNNQETSVVLPELRTLSDEQRKARDAEKTRHAQERARARVSRTNQFDQMEAERELETKRQLSLQQAEKLAEKERLTELSRLRAEERVRMVRQAVNHVTAENAQALVPEKPAHDPAKLERFRRKTTSGGWSPGRFSTRRWRRSVRSQVSSCSGCSRSLDEFHIQGWRRVRRFALILARFVLLARLDALRLLDRFHFGEHLGQVVVVVAVVIVVDVRVRIVVVFVVLVSVSKLLSLLVAHRLQSSDLKECDWKSCFSALNASLWSRNSLTENSEQLELSPQQQLLGGRHCKHRQQSARMAGKIDLFRLQTQVEAAMEALLRIPASAPTDSLPYAFLPGVYRSVSPNSRERDTNVVASGASPVTHASTAELNDGELQLVLYGDNTFEYSWTMKRSGARAMEFSVEMQGEWKKPALNRSRRGDEDQRMFLHTKRMRF
ncbi:hypothetical protein FI667_g2487, partial [Globisporangium splendens]